ncbi:methyl-CpG-binding domain-containing protein 10-like isoform X2 [Andrographis paniculata]|uniref:methyl-CpG-binding domain-containing protein 10-like isoform X2 n=1 Tax=Andrographis paniculata TaxID=175694 RepID=UPI0021E98671|nr:methyl-CpG-binding domain-containing protein 10-like isoform X2 [Andrographis paniculata]
MAAEEDSKKDDGVSIELPAPAGWVKKVTPKKGGTPQRNDILFISPTGEEIKTKRQLEQYLKSHPGGPAASEFEWATGDTPRRSARLSEKSKAVETAATQSPTKKQKRSATKRGGANEKSNATTDGEAAVEKETKESNDIPITDTKEDEGTDKTNPPQPQPQPLPENTNNEENSNTKESIEAATDSAANAKTDESKETATQNDEPQNEGKETPSENPVEKEPSLQEPPTAAVF